MDLQTHVMNAIEIAGDKMKYDAEIKTVLSDKDILAYILKYTTKEFCNYNVDTIKQCIEGEPDVGTIPTYPGLKKMDAIKGENTEDVVPNEGKITFDIRFSAVTPEEEHIKILINIEAQKKYHPGYDLVPRAIFYCARMLSGQLETEFHPENYDDIKKVYSIWICMDTPKYAENTITSYDIVPNKIYGDFCGNVRYDLLSAVMVCLSQNDQVFGGNELHKLLSTVLSHSMDINDKEQILNNDFHIKTSRKLKEGFNIMCNLSDLIEERAMERGMEKGMERGMEKGMEKGRISAYVEMVKDGVLSLADAAAKLCLSEAELKAHF